MKKKSSKLSVFERIFWDSVESGINPHPDSYTAEELKYFNPEIPSGHIDDHVAKRDKNKGN